MFRVNLCGHPLSLKVGPLMTMICLSIGLRNNSAVPAGMNRKDTLLGETYKARLSQKKNTGLSVQGDGLELASFAGHTVDVHCE